MGGEIDSSTGDIDSPAVKIDSPAVKVKLPFFKFSSDFLASLPYFAVLPISFGMKLYSIPASAISA